MTIDDLPPADYESARKAALALAPDYPLHLLRRHVIHYRTQKFMEGFPGEAAYAVRANFEPAVIDTLHAAGIDWYACDSIGEMEVVFQQAPSAKFIFAHPIKTEKAIETAYKRYGVRAFVIDHPHELKKVLAHTETDATILVRLAGSAGAMVSEGYRYGCDIDQAAFLVKAVVEAGYKVGLCFSPGSQVLNPLLYDEGFLALREVMYRTRFMLNMVYIGGGFPSIYEGVSPPEVENYFKVIRNGLSRLHLPRTCKVIASSGRYLVNEAVSVLVRVEQRKGQMLYLNDGTLGSLSPINMKWWRPPIRLIRTAKDLPQPAYTLDRFAFSGPIAYGSDTMNGPFYLPEDARVGDYIEMGKIGAYAGSMVTGFQCQPLPEMVTVGDMPLEASRPEEMPHDAYESLLTDDDSEEYETNRYEADQRDITRTAFNLDRWLGRR